MADNLFANIVNGAVCLQDVAANVLFNTNNLLEARELYNGVYRSYKPGRPINGFTTFVKDRVYLIVPKLNLDLTSWLVPPIVDISSTTTTTTTSPTPPSTGYRYATSQDLIDYPQMSSGDYVIDGANSGTEIQVRQSFGINNYPYNGLSAGNKIWIKSGTYYNIYLELPNCVGSAGNPIIVSTYGGQVKWTNRMSIVGGQYLKFTGKYDSGNNLGHVNFQGHDAGYAFSRDKYLFVYDNQWTDIGDSAPSAIGVDGGANNLEFEYMEMRDGAFSPIIVNAANSNIDYINILMHDSYIHDMNGEVYFGSTGGDPQRNITGLRFYNNRVIRAGNDGGQFGQMSSDNQIYNNVFALPGLNWKNAFEQYQDNGIQFGIRKGGTLFQNNLVISSGQDSMIMFYNPKSGLAVDGTGVTINNNFFGYGKGPFDMYFGSQNGGLLNTPVVVTNNYFGLNNFRYDEVYLDGRATDTGYLIRNAISNNTFTIQNNVYDSSRSNVFQEQGTGNTVNESSNTQTTIDPIEFVNFLGFNVGFDYATIDRWAPAIGTLGGWVNDGTSLKNTPISYSIGDYVFHKSKFYKSKVDNNVGIEPGITSGWQSYWTQIWWDIATGVQIEDPTNTTGYTQYPPDDVRLSSDSTYNLLNMGLLDNPPYGETTTTTTSTSTSSTSTTSTTTTVPNGTVTLAAEDNGNNTYTLKWNRKRSQLTSSPIIVGIGSSTLAGTGAVTPNKLGERIQAALDPYSGRFVNVAVSGYDTRYFLPDDAGGLTQKHRNATALRRIRPTAAIISLPSNDIGAGLTPQEFTDNMVAIYNEFYTLNIPCFIISPQPRSSFSTQEKADLVTAKNLMVATFPSAFFIDVYDMLSDGNNNIASQYSAGDGIHLNDSGHILVSNAVMAAIEDYFQDQNYMEYLVERSTDGVNFSTFDTVSGGTSITKTYDREDDTLYFFRVTPRFQNGTYDVGTNIVFIQQLYQPGAIEQTTQFDFSLNTTTAPPTGWNNLAVPSTGPTLSQTFSSIVDSTNSATGYSLTVTKAFSGALAGGGTWAQYSIRATEDAWLYNNTLSDFAEIEISGLDDSKIYSMDIVVSRATTDLSRFSAFECSDRFGGARAATASDVANTTQLVSLYGLITDGSGNLRVDMRAVGSSGYINALILNKHTAVSGPSTTTTTSTSTSTSTTSSSTTTTTTAGSTTSSTTTTTTAAPSISYINVNIYGGTNPYSNSAWNDWNLTTAELTSGATFTNLKYSDGSSSSFNATISYQLNVADNGSSYGGTILPPEVLRYASYSTSNRTITLSGLSNSNTYTIELVGSRANTGNNTDFTIGGNTQNLVTDSNKTNSVIFSNISPSSGNIVITLARGSGATYNYINGFKITENGSGTTTTSTSTSTTSTSSSTTTTTTAGSTTTSTSTSTTSTTTNAGTAQFLRTFTVSTQTWNAYVKLPPTYYTDAPSTTYPLIVFFPGLGEVGSNSNLLLNYGPSRYINNGSWDGGINTGSGNEYPIIISMQPATAWPPNSYCQAAVDAAIAAYRTDTNRVYLTGLSMGGWITSQYVSFSTTNADKIAAIVNIQGVVPDNGTSAMDKFTRGRWLGYEQSQDYRSMDTIVSVINTANPAESPVAAQYFITSFSGGTHCCFNNWYDPSLKAYPSPSTGSDQSTDNIYQWMMRQTLM